MRRAISWLDPRVEPSEARRFAAALLLRQMAEQAPAVFNVHVKAFIDHIWPALRDSKPHIREAAVSALKVTTPPTTCSLFICQQPFVALLSQRTRQAVEADAHAPIAWRDSLSSAFRGVGVLVSVLLEGTARRLHTRLPQPDHPATKPDCCYCADCSCAHSPPTATSAPR